MQFIGYLLTHPSSRIETFREDKVYPHEAQGAEQGGGRDEAAASSRSRAFVRPHSSYLMPFFSRKTGSRKARSDIS